EVVAVPGAAGVDLEAALFELGRRGVIDLLVEGGPALEAALLGAGLVDRGVFYFGSRLGGGVGRPVLDGVFGTLSDVRPVQVVDVRRVGTDLRVEFLLEGG
ncbi:MAG: RibD family protein, partial [Acidimicrobiia bacterium]